MIQPFRYQQQQLPPMPPCKEPFDPLDESHYDGESLYDDDDSCIPETSLQKVHEVKEEEQLFEIEMIKGKREVKDLTDDDMITEYLVKYRGYETDHDEWRT